MSKNAGNDLSVKAVSGAAVAVIVAVAGVVSGVPALLVVVAAVSSSMGFWLLDSFLSRSSGPATATGVAPSAAGREHTVGSPGELPPPTQPQPTRSARLDPDQFDESSAEIVDGSQGAGRAFWMRIAKHGQSIRDCEDAVAVDVAHGVLAVADGASSSFGAGSWANALAAGFVEAPPAALSIGSFSTWLDHARESWAAVAEHATVGSDGWWNEEGARRGAFSTVVGAVIVASGDQRAVTVMCLGDSCAFVLTGEIGDRVMKRSLPYDDAQQFGSHPSLLGSMAARRHDEPTWTTIPVSPGDVIVLASDAVAEWLLGDPRRCGLIDEIEPTTIASRLVDERTSGLIVNDDLTLAVIEVV